MGAVAAAPVACVASMCGGCLTAGCCKLASAGSTDTNKGARCVLFWLNAVALLMAVLIGWSTSWLDTPCQHIMDWGICECYSVPHDHHCYQDQLVFRTELSAFIVFIVLLIISVSGCAKHAGQSCPFGKFLAFLLLFALSLFVPNAVFNVFGNVAGVGSACYLVAQYVLLMDFAYSWNEAWHTKAVQLQRELQHQGHKMWLVAIIMAAALMLILALVECILLSITFTTAGARALVLASFLVGIVLLLVSITDWCEHGSLLASSVVVAYIMWLCYEALSMLPLDDGGKLDLLPGWVGIIVCVLSLAAFALSTNFNSGKSAAPSQSSQEGMEQGEAAAKSEAVDDDSVASEVDAWDFTVQCLVHAAATIYICSTLAPVKSPWTFIARVIAVVLSLALYGWSLVAPKVLKNRKF